MNNGQSLTKTIILIRTHTHCHYVMFVSIRHKFNSQFVLVMFYVIMYVYCPFTFIVLCFCLICPPSRLFWLINLHMQKLVDHLQKKKKKKKKDTMSSSIPCDWPASVVQLFIGLFCMINRDAVWQA